MTTTLPLDAAVEAALRNNNIAVHHTKDAVIFEREEVLTAAGAPYSVFTPYKNAWLKRLTPFDLQAYPVDAYADRLAAQSSAIPSLQDIGFEPANLRELKLPTGMAGGAQLFEDFLERIDRYQDTRDFPAQKGPSYLSVHLRFGTVSIRQLAAAAWQQGGRADLAVRTDLARFLSSDSLAPSRRRQRACLQIAIRCVAVAESPRPL